MGYTLAEKTVSYTHLEMFEEDYLNRANVAANLYSREKENGIDWDDMLNILEVEGVNIVDESGTIVESSNPDNVGINCYQEEIFAGFLPLIEGRAGQESHIQMERRSDEAEKQKIYVGIKKTDAPKGMIQLEVSSESLEQYESLVSLENILTSIPTERYRFLFALEQKTKRLLAISRNNDLPTGYTLDSIYDMEELSLIHI